MLVILIVNHCFRNFLDVVWVIIITVATVSVAIVSIAVFINVSVVGVFIANFYNPIDLKYKQECIMQYRLIHKQLHDGKLGIHAIC